MLHLPDYPNGKVFFEDTRRMFAFDHPCENCVAVHNNWIIGTPAKVYRCVADWLSAECVAIARGGTCLHWPFNLSQCMCLMAGVQVEGIHVVVRRRRGVLLFNYCEVPGVHDAAVVVKLTGQ